MTYRDLAIFAAGVVIGAVGVYAVRDRRFRHMAAKVVGKGLQLKDDAAALMESIKEDAEDIMAEARHNSTGRGGRGAGPKKA